MSKYILSKMSMGVAYCFYHTPTSQGTSRDGTGELPAEKFRVTIRGGAGLTSGKSGFGNMEQGEDGMPMWTPDGVVTVIKDEVYEQLKDHHVFKSHLEKGLIKVVNHDISQNHGAVAKESAGMAKDPFAPMKPGDADKRIKITTATQRDEDVNDLRL